MPEKFLIDIPNLKGLHEIEDMAGSEFISPLEARFINGVIAAILLFRYLGSAPGNLQSFDKTAFVFPILVYRD